MRLEPGEGGVVRSISIPEGEWRPATAEGPPRLHPFPRQHAVTGGRERLQELSFPVPPHIRSGIWCSGDSAEIRIFNDPCGLQRVCWARENGWLHFAGDLPELFRSGVKRRPWDLQSVAEWLRLGAVLEDRTLFQGIHLLPAGSEWTFRPTGEVRRRRYFEASVAGLAPLSAGDWEEELESRASAAVDRLKMPSEPAVLSLTGGLDSRLLLALLAPEPGQLPCHTFAGPLRPCHDAVEAGRMARAAGQAHEMLRIDRRFFDEFPALAEAAAFFSEGGMDASGAVELHMNRRVRNLAPVRLTGSYGSEVLRGHVALRPQKTSARHLLPELVPRMVEAEATWRELRRLPPASFIAFCQVPWLHHSRYALEVSQVDVRSPYLDAELIRLSHQAPEGQTASPGPLLRLIGRRSSLPAPAGLLRSRWRSLVGRLESRWDYGCPDWLCRLERLPGFRAPGSLLLGREKFCHFRQWYREPLAAALHEMLPELRGGAGVYRHGAADTLVREHTRGAANHTLELHRLLALHFTARHFS